MRAVFEFDCGRRFCSVAIAGAEEAQYKSHQLILRECAQHNATVLGDGQHEVQWHNVDIIAVPGRSLHVLSSVKIFQRFQRANLKVGHG